MRFFIAAIFICAVFINSGCSMTYDAYLRNFSKEKAVVDVYLYSKKWMKTLPNRVDVADTALEFKFGFRNKIDKTQLVRWLDTSHFQFELQPNSTADLSDMAGRFVNGGCYNNVLVTITNKQKLDTIYSPKYKYASKLKRRYKFFARPILYYDVK